MDQLCVDQENSAEKSQEVLKMRQYYSNATVTLIALNDELEDINNIDLMKVLKKIIKSE